MFPPISLASKPAHQVIMREATTAESLDFCDVVAEHEEVLTTKFLNTVQDKESFSDSREWTADDRRLALFWYWIHTTEDTFVELPYLCSWCNKEHVHGFDMRDLAGGYQEIKGLAMRDVEFEGRKLVVSPLNGTHMELLEQMRFGLQPENKGTPAYERQSAQIRLSMLQGSISLSDDHEKVQRKRDKALSDWMLNLPASKFTKLKGVVDKLLSEMQHGLPSKIVDGKIMLKSTPHVCPTMIDGKEVITELLVSFRDYSRIPRI